MGWHQILGLLSFLFFLHVFLPFASSLCPPDQRDALLLFKNYFQIDSMASHFNCDEDLYYPVTSYPKTNLWNIGVDCCSWDGITCDDVTGNVIILDLTCSWLCGTLHSNSSLFLLRHLQSLNLSGNNFTGSQISPNLSAFGKMTHLNLSRSHFSVMVPSKAVDFEKFTKLKNLQMLNISLNLNLTYNTLKYTFPKLKVLVLSSCNLTKFPYFLSSLERLTHLDLSSNRISGELPPSICQMSSLQYLFLYKNNLSGNMPLCFGNMTNLLYLHLSSNKLQGPLPRSLVKCVNLSVLVLSDNEFNDIFPHWLEAPQLHTLDLRANRFHGSINLTTFGLSFPSLKYLLISYNNFTGRLPTEVFSNTSLFVLKLSHNNFGGPIPLPSPFTFYYCIANNNLIGNISSLICNATKLEHLDLSNNSFTGSLPQCLTNLTINLSVLNLRMNLLEGTIPLSFSWRNSLSTLDLSQNRLEGTLPWSLVRCKYLEILDLSDNHIEDGFPIWLGTLPELKVLVLRSNNFKGILNLPKEAHLFPKLHILDISNNNFGGPLPTNLIMNLRAMMDEENGQKKSLYMTRFFRRAIGYENSIAMSIKGQIELLQILTIFTIIDLSHNSFEGDIPGVIGHLHSLIGLNLSHNHLTGSIPITLENLTNLEWLDLSSNKLGGVIPRKLGDLSSLGYLNLSKNKFIGRIPQDKQLSTFSKDSFSGNPGLCGTPLPKACPGDAQPPLPSSLSSFDHTGHESWIKQKTLWIGYASGIVIGISIAYITFHFI